MAFFFSLFFFKCKDCFPGTFESLFFRLVPMVIQTPTHGFQAGIYSRKFVLEKMNSPGEGQGLHMPQVQLVLMHCPLLEPC